MCGALTGQIVAAATVRRGFDQPRLLPRAGRFGGIPLRGLAALAGHGRLRALVLGTLPVPWCLAMLLARQLPHITAGGCSGGWGWPLGGVMGGLGWLHRRAAHAVGAYPVRV